MIVLCKPIASQWLSKIAQKIKRRARTPSLGVLLVGQDPASQRFVQSKKRAAERIGVKINFTNVPVGTSTTSLVQCVATLAGDSTGVLVQLPLPADVEAGAVLDAVPARQDVDGLGSASLSALVRNTPGFVPATVRGILYLLEKQSIMPKGTRFLIVGAGQLVGRPLGLALLNRGATVTWADRYEVELAALSRQADVLVSAVGKPGLIRGCHVHAGQLVIDAGFNLQAGKVTGDVVTEEVSKAGAVVTPVPGGVGKLTVVALLANLLEASAAARA
ncbi:MAG: bifunctional 5,10-methylenetetrahydrofolate dehydrogenase/5,10-methenyltetrahydrofolate cyclohydrolase [Parcubacteria group bacterium]